MTIRPAKVIPFPAKQRHVRARVTATGELIQLVSISRKSRDDDGPRAA